jgi:hypothetical protein
MVALFAVFTVGQLAAGHAEHNSEQQQHGQAAISFNDYLATGHPWEALFENWESEFLQMAVFVIFTTFLYQRGSPESRRVGVTEPYDVDPRRFRDSPDAPSPVKTGGIALWLYERSLGLAFVALFLVSFAGHMVGGWFLLNDERRAHGLAEEPLLAYVSSSTFWFESFQNWQSEFLSLAAMVWLSVYLRQRGSPESKPVHVAHDEPE